MYLDPDKITTICGIITGIAGGVAVFLGPELGVVVTKCAAGVAMIAAALLGYFCNKTEE